MLQNIGSTPGPKLIFVDAVDLPEAGSKNAKVLVRNYDLAGFDADADSEPTISILDHAGADCFGVVSETVMVRTGVGAYELNFVIQSTGLPGDYRIIAKILNNTKLATVVRMFTLMDFDNDPVKVKVESCHITTRSQLNESIAANDSSLLARFDTQDIMVASQHVVTRGTVVSQHVLTQTRVDDKTVELSQIIDLFSKQIPRMAHVVVRPVVIDSVPVSDIESYNDNWTSKVATTADASGGTPQLRWDPMYAMVVEHPYNNEVFNSGKFSVVGSVHVFLKWKTNGGANGGNSFWVVKSGDEAGGIGSGAAFDLVIGAAEADSQGQYCASPVFPSPVAKEEVHVFDCCFKTDQMVTLPFSLWLAAQVNSGGTTIETSVSSRTFLEFTYKSVV
jgi:hypothetical protein